MKSLAGTDYHRNYQARMRKSLPARAKKVPYWRARIAAIQQKAREGGYPTQRGYKHALSTAQRCLRVAENDLAFAEQVAAGKLKPYLNDDNFIDWK